MEKIDKIAWVCIQNKKVLGTLSKGKDKYYVPGGKREAGETDLETLIREVKEELTVDIDAPAVRYYETFEDEAHGKPKGTIVKMTCYTAEYEGELKANNEIEKFEWLRFEDIDMTTSVTKMLIKDLFDKGLIE